MKFQSTDLDQDDYPAREDEVLVFTLFFALSFSFRLTIQIPAANLHAGVFGAGLTSSSGSYMMKQMRERHTLFFRRSLKSIRFGGEMHLFHPITAAAVKHACLLTWMSGNRKTDSL